MKHIGIILRKELRSYFDSPVAYIFIIIFLLLGGMYFINNFFLQNVSSLKTLFEVTPILLLFFAPAITMRLISDEKRSGTFEIIGTKPIKTGEIVLGKFFAAWLLVFFSMLPTLLYLLAIVFIGKVDIGESFAGYFGLLLLGGAFVAIGVLGSTLSENQIVSFIVSFVIILALFGIEKVLIYVPMKFVPFVEYFGVDHHVSSFARGIIDTRDIIYLVSLMILALLAATIFAEVETVGTVLKLRVFGWKQQLPRLALVIVILVFANLLSFKVFSRTDMTSNKAYTLTSTTKSLLKSLDDDFVVKAYFSPNLPPPYHSHRQIVQEQLDEYRAYAPGNFHYQFLNPFTDPDVEHEALQQGISPVQVKIIKNDKYQTEKAYVGLVYSYGDKIDRTPTVQNPQQLEYYIASSIKKMISGQTRKVAFTTGQNEHDLSTMNGFKQALRRNYDVATIDLAGDKLIPSDIAALVVVAPQTRFTDRAKFMLDQFIMRGGRVAFFIKSVGVNQQAHIARPLTVNLDDMFESYGWILNHDLVADAHCRNTTVSWNESNSSTSTDIAYPFFPVVSDFNADILGVKELSPTSFAYVSSLDTRIAEIRGVTADVLLVSSSQSKVMQGDTINIDPRQNFNVNEFTEQHIPLAAGFEGAFKSWYVKYRPQSGEGSSAAPAISQSPSTRIVVVGDGDFVLDENQHGYDNISFASTCIDWLFDDVELHTIRTRTTEAKPLNDISEGMKTMVKYFDFAGPPAVVIFVGLVRLMKRNTRRKKRQQTY